MQHSKNLDSDLPWIEKYRPENIDDIVSHEWIINSLKYFIESETMPHLIFYGPSGSGKSTTVKCCINKIYGNLIDLMTFSLNASADRGIEVIRTLVRSFADRNVNASVDSKNARPYKLMILEEVDSMTSDAQSMLRQIIERNCSDTRFCMICNEIEKICPALRSRCVLFRFPPLPIADVDKILLRIVNDQKLSITQKALKACSSISNGDMRTSINLLQQASTAFPDLIERSHIYKLSGEVDIDMIEKSHMQLMMVVKNEDRCNDVFSNCISYLQSIWSISHVRMEKILAGLANCVWNEKELTVVQQSGIIIGLGQLEICAGESIDNDAIIISLVSCYAID